jgi:hypothetical protein
MRVTVMFFYWSYNTRQVIFFSVKLKMSSVTIRKSQLSSPFDQLFTVTALYCITLVTHDNASYHAYIYVRKLSNCKPA